MSYIIESILYAVLGLLIGYLLIRLIRKVGTPDVFK